MYARSGLRLAIIQLVSKKLKHRQVKDFILDRLMFNIVCTLCEQQFIKGFIAQLMISNILEFDIALVLLEPICGTKEGALTWL